MPSLETANVGKAVAARVGSNIREVRTKLGMTQAQLAAPEFSISYISAIERGKIRPSLKALSILAPRLNVPPTFLIEGSPAGIAEARAVGYSPADAGPDPKIEVDLLQAGVLVQQGCSRDAEQLLLPIQAERITTDQAYRLSYLRGAIHLAAGEYQEAVVDLQAALSQGESLNNVDARECARNLLGQAYYALHHDTLALEQHLSCLAAIENGQVNDPFFSCAVLGNLANDSFHLGDLEKAIRYHHRALDLLNGMGLESKSYAQKYMEISQQYQSVGKFPLAREYAMQSLSIYEMRQEQRRVGLTHQHLGKTFEKQGLLEAAEAEYRTAIAMERSLNDEDAVSQCLTALAELLLRGERTEEAEGAAQEALEYAQAGGDSQTQGHSLITLAQIRHQQGTYQEADHLFGQALALLDTANSHEAAAHAYFRYATLLEERGEVQRSLTAIKQAYDHQQREKHGDVGEARENLEQPAKTREEGITIRCE